MESRRNAIRPWIRESSFRSSVLDRLIHIEFLCESGIYLPVIMVILVPVTDCSSHDSVTDGKYRSYFCVLHSLPLQSAQDTPFHLRKALHVWW